MVKSGLQSPGNRKNQNQMVDQVSRRCDQYGGELIKYGWHIVMGDYTAFFSKTGNRAVKLQGNDIMNA